MRGAVPSAGRLAWVGALWVAALTLGLHAQQAPGTPPPPQPDIPRFGVVEYPQRKPGDPAAIRALGDAIFHVHAKDLAFDRANTAVNGVLDTKSYTRMSERAWLFRSVGWGHDELEWKRIVSALRVAGYDYVMSIEHEDGLASVDEGLRAAVDLLHRVVLAEPPATPWWT